MSRAPFQKPERFYFWYRKFYWTYWTKYTWYINPYSNNEEWHCWDEWSVFVGLKSEGDKWFDTESHYYDGHTFESITICGIVFGKMYSYDARPVKEG